MPKFIAIKVHYDHRHDLPHYLKYTRQPTEREYNEYLELYQSGVGGEGFHECMNFSIPEHGRSQFYLPPGYMPAIDTIEEEFVFFTFTYKDDKELSAGIVGIHANARFFGKEGIKRQDAEHGRYEYDLDYHGDAPTEFVTIFTAPVQYDVHAGRHTPKLRKWGNGLRNIDAQHAKNIIRDAFSLAAANTDEVSSSELAVIQNQLQVLSRIHLRYFGESLEIPDELHIENLDGEAHTPPDMEMANFGEYLVYQQELEYARINNIPVSEVEWLSRAAPTSVFDILSKRIVNGVIENHFVEVKSSRLDLGGNVYVSGRQLRFLEGHPASSSIAFVNFGGTNKDYEITYSLAAEVLESHEF